MGSKEALRKLVKSPVGIIAIIVVALGVIVAGVLLNSSKKPVTSLSGLGVQATGTFCEQNATGYTQWCNLLSSNTTVSAKITTQTSVLAIPDTAFSGMNAQDATFLQSHPQLVDQILEYQILDGAYDDAAMGKTQTIPTVQGESIDAVYTASPQSLVLNGPVGSAKVLNGATLYNGVNFFPLDGVLVPQAVASQLPSNGGGGTTTQNIYDYIASQTSLSKLKAAFDASPSKASVTGTNAFTLLAPTDAAFNAMPAAVAAYLADPNNAADLDRVLKYHLIRRATDAVDLLSQGTLTSLYGATMTVTGDSVIPSGSVPNITFTSDGGNFHAKITSKYDVPATNGEVQWVDSVLIPQAVMTKINENPVTDLNLYETIAADSNLSTLKALIDKTGLKQTLQSTSEFTMFAPTNAAFTAVPADKLAKIQANVDLLTQVLNFHLVSGKYKIDSLPDNPTSVQGEMLTTKKTLDSNGSVLSITVNGASVITRNKFATNAYLNTMDTVLIPQAVEDALKIVPTNNTPSNNTTNNTPSNNTTNNTVGNNTTGNNTAGNFGGSGSGSGNGNGSGSTVPVTGAGEVVSVAIAVLIGIIAVSFYVVRKRKHIEKMETEKKPENNQSDQQL